MEDKNAIITPGDIERLIKMREKQLYLQKHENKIWQGTNGKWYTYIRDNSKRRLIKKNSLDDLENYIWSYYSEKADNPTVEELFNTWINYKMEVGEIHKGTKDRYICDFNRYFSASMFKLQHIKTITEDDIDIFIRKTLSSHDLTQKAYSNLRTIILGIFKYAKRQHYTDISISTFFQDVDISKKLFKPSEKRLDTAVFTVEETNKLLYYLKTHQTIENLGLVFAFQSGVRCGELAAIKFSDISDNILHVQRQEIVYKSSETGKQVHEVVKYTKTETGDRYIYLPENAFNTLMAIRWLNRDNEYMMAKNGKRINKTAFNNILKRACKAVDIPPRTMHKIRRTYGTTLIDNNVEDSLIMSQMGHTDISTTRKYYYYANKDSEYKRKQIENSINF